MAIATQMIAPPMMVFMLGTSLIPRIGSQAQKIPPTTSSRDSIVNSPDRSCLDPMLNKIKPLATRVPWVTLK